MDGVRMLVVVAAAARRVHAGALKPAALGQVVLTM
jgi:hypothetical protein